MRLKDVTEFCPAYTGATRNDAVAFVPMEALRYDSIAQQEIPFEEARGKYTFFADGDLLFAKVTPCFENGNIAVANNLKGGIGFGSSEIFVLRAKPGLNNRYLFYVVQASPFMDGGCATMCGVGGLKRMSPLFPRTFEWEIPSEESQQAIVAYLDEKTAAIDARVAVLEKKLAAYKRLKASVINRAVTRGLDPKAKLKDSGVEWIGKVPAGWEVRNLSQCFGFFKGLAITKADLTETGIPVISYGQIHSKLNIGTHLKPELLRYVPEAITAADPNSRLKVGDIVFADTSEDVEGCGNCVLMDAGAPVYAGYHAIVARPDESQRSRYFSYLFNASCWRSQIRSKVAGIKVFSITQRIFKGVSLLLPSITDANAIADYLDAECAKIDKMAELVTREIEFYKKLKRSLINEVVTGKRPVFADKPLRRGKEVA